MNLNQLDATTLKGMLSKGDVSSVEIMQSVLSQIETTDGEIGAYLNVRPYAELLHQAHLVDQKRMRGDFVGPLAGLPVAVKDNICTRNLYTTCASKMLEHYMPPYDATVVEKISMADGIIIGKTNMDEFAMGSSTENSAFRLTRNPINRDYVPGGTSGGSAAAVASHETILALGSDTGGSIRQPASFCGVVGLKPTYGRVSRYGLIAYGSSLDQIGPIAKTPMDAKLLFSVVSGYDPKDATSILESTARTRIDTNRRLRIGIPKEYFIDGIDVEVRSCGSRFMSALTSLGLDLVDISLPHTQYAVPAYYIIASAEMSANLARYDGVRFGYRSSSSSNLQDMYRHSRSEALGPEVKRRILLGTYVLSAGYYDAYYRKALDTRILIGNDFTRAWESCDFILTPVAPTPAFKIGAKTSNPLEMYLGDIFSVTANLTGLPAISIPFGHTSTGLPLSMQLIGPKLSEEVLLDLAHNMHVQTVGEVNA